MYREKTTRDICLKCLLSTFKNNTNVLTSIGDNDYSKCLICGDKDFVIGQIILCNKHSNEFI